MQVNEGYPMAAPTSTVLQATKRATRYWPLYTQVQAAVTAAFATQAGASSAVQKDPLNDINSLPGMAFALGKHRCECCWNASHWQLMASAE